MASIVAEYWFCLKCTLVHANGECGELEDDEPEPLSLVDDRYVAQGAHDHSDCCTEGDRYAGCDCDHMEFSRLKCDGCGSRLRGERYAHVLFDS